MTCDFTSFPFVFRSYKNDGRVIMNGCVQQNIGIGRGGGGGSYKNDGRVIMNGCVQQNIGIGRGEGGGGGGGGGGQAPNNFGGGGGQQTLWPNNSPTFSFYVYVKQ